MLTEVVDRAMREALILSFYRGYTAGRAINFWSPEDIFDKCATLVGTTKDEVRKVIHLARVRDQDEPNSPIQELG